MIDVYILTIKAINSAENIALKKMLQEFGGFSVHFINGITGETITANEYYRLIKNYIKNTGVFVTPSEAACSIGHKFALEALIKSGKNRAVILEDDVILCSSSLNKLRNVFYFESKGSSIIHLGGIDGIEDAFRGLRGLLVSKEPEIYLLDNDSLGSLWRTVAYLIDRNCALNLVNFIRDNIFIADDYCYMVKNNLVEKIYFSNVVKHPVVLQNSGIEAERNTKPIFYSRISLFSRIKNKIKYLHDYRLRKNYKYFLYDLV
ncbi:MAG: hypothetical protein EOM90_15615 [Alphaproteobacteria bacterium]|nr:hypothetical protein [Alphaproteobacteria bacterium]